MEKENLFLMWQGKSRGSFLEKQNAVASQAVVFVWITNFAFMKRIDLSSFRVLFAFVSFFYLIIDLRRNFEKGM